MQGSSPQMERYVFPFVCFRNRLIWIVLQVKRRAQVKQGLLSDTLSNVVWNRKGSSELTVRQLSWKVQPVNVQETQYETYLVICQIFILYILKSKQICGFRFMYDICKLQALLLQSSDTDSCRCLMLLYQLSFWQLSQTHQNWCFHPYLCPMI